MVHVSGTAAKHPTVIGDNVIVESGAIVHGCTLESDSFVGSGAQVLDGAVVKSHAIVAPGSLVGQNKVVPSRQLWAGVPARYQRDLTESEVAQIALKSKENFDLSLIHAAECAKTWEVIEEDQYEYEQTSQRNPDYYTRLNKEVCLFVCLFVCLYVCSHIILLFYCL